jgi:hypothetical protein
MTRASFASAERGAAVRLVALACACALVAGCTGRDSSRASAAAPGGGITAGQSRTVGDLGNGQGVTCPTSFGRLNEMVKSSATGDTDGYQEAVEDAETLHSGQRVTVVEVDDPQHIELRLVGGPDAGITCWTAERAELFR